MILAQIIIFLLGWPLEGPRSSSSLCRSLPLLPHFGIDPLFFGLLVALNLQTAFLSPPVAMAAFYLKGVSPPHVTLNQILRVCCHSWEPGDRADSALCFPGIGMWLPRLVQIAK